MNKAMLARLLILSLIFWVAFEGGFPGVKSSNGRMIDVYGGAVNWGHGHLPFPAPFGGQGQNAPMDMVSPGSWVYLNANVTYNYWPVQHKNVAFEIQEPNGTVYTKLSAFTDANGVASVSFQMPWSIDIYSTSHSLIGLWKVTATAQLADVVINDTMEYNYDYFLHIWSTTTDKPEYFLGEPVSVTITYGSHYQQTLPILCMTSITDALGVTIGRYNVWASLEGATFPAYNNWINTVTILIPNWTYPGIATLHIDVFDKEPCMGGVALTTEYVGPTMAIQPSAAPSFAVPDCYPTIQAAINNAASGDTIYVRQGTYFENVVLNKTITLVGQNPNMTFINGGGIGNVITVEADDVEIRGFTIAESGIEAAGIALENCNNTILRNDNIESNDLGVFLNSVSGSSVYNNNFVNNTRNALDVNSTGVWDHGYPSGGNFWANYTGVDLCSGPYQNFTGSDGIGDEPYIIDENNSDHYPFVNSLVTPEIADLAITDITPTTATVLERGSLEVNVTIANYGSNSQESNLSICLQPEPNLCYQLAFQSVLLQPQENSTLSMVGNIGYIEAGNYSLVASVQPVPSEIDLRNNVLVGENITILPNHNLAVKNVLTKSIVGKGCSSNITVVVENIGMHSETFNTVACFNSTAVILPDQRNFTTVSLGEGEAGWIIFVWNTSDVPLGNYTIWAYTEPVPGETNTADNNFTGGWVVVAGMGDLTGGTPNALDFVPDGQVNIVDVAVVAKFFSQKAPPAPANCDVSGTTIGVPDGKIDITDVATVAKHFGQHYPYP